MRVGAVTASGAGLLASAVALRWSRPDLTAALAEHVGEVSTGDDSTWVAAAGWLVHGRAAVGDGRQCASDVLGEIARRGPGLLDDPAADRLRIEVAVLAAGQCEPAVARLLVAPLLGADRSAEVRADALGVLARCVMEERPTAVGEATRRAEVAWAEIGGPDAEIAGAALALLSAAALRRSGHPDSAVVRAAEGLARLERFRGAQEGPPPRHLAAALGAEWITALIEAGRPDDARDGCVPMAQQLHETTRPTRQIALLRLAVARALAESTSVDAVEALEQAARDAAECDAPDLEGLCLSTLGALREQSGRLDAALESMRRGVAAQRRDRARSERFRAALGALALGSHSAQADAAGVPRRPERVATGPVRAPATSHVTAAEGNVEGNLVEPVHPLAGGGEIDPWSTGTWANRPSMVATDPGGRPRRGGGARMGPELTAGSLGPSDGSVVGLAGVTDPAMEAVHATAQPISGDRGIEDIPVARDERPAQSTYDGERWLEGALAELDRVWGQPLPDLDRHVVPPAGPAATQAADPSNSNGHATDAIGCVVVIDVVRSGAPVPDGGEVLREVGERLKPRIPGGARLRFEVDESALSVVLPGRERSVATNWMYETLPAVFADVTDLGALAQWDTGTTVRATVHDTDGPFGAQLLQRLDPVAPPSPVPRAQHDVAPPAVVRWGVPIPTGSGGRRRRADDAPDADRADETAPEAGERDRGPALSYWGSWAAPQRVQRRVEPASETSGRHREPPSAPEAGRSPGRSPGGPTGAGQVVGDTAVTPASPQATPQTNPQANRRAELPSDRPEPVSVERQADPAAATAADESAFSVEGLGLADLLAGALAAYRGI